MKKLLPYQRTAYAAILAAVATRVALLVMATGLGKTVVAAAFARWWLKNKKTPILFLVHLDDAIKQAMKEFGEAIGSEVGFQYLNEDGTLDPTATVVFCTFQTMHNRRRKIRCDAFGLLIVDEGHRSMAATYRPTIEHFRAEFRFAMTATPDRMDGLDIRDLFGEPVFNFPLAKALANHALADVDYQVLLSDVNQEALTDALKRIKSGDRRVTRDQIDRTVFLAEKLEATVERIRKAQETRRKTILFCQNKAHARAMVSFFPEAKLYISGIPQRELEERLPAFRAGQVRTLITVDKLNEAVDVPDVDHLVFLRQTGSARIWLQQLGRGLRKSPGKTDVLVQDFVANCDRLYEVAKLVEDVGSHVNRKGPTHTGSGIHTTGLDFTFSKEARDLLDVLERMENLPEAGKDGTFEADGETWGTIAALANLLQLSENTISKSVIVARVLNGKNASGQQNIFYALSDARKACSRLLKKIPKVGPDGTFEIEGKVWGTVRALMRTFRLSRRAIKIRISGCCKQDGKDRVGRRCTFYSLLDVKEACSDLLEKVPKAGKDGTFKADGEIWGTLRVIARTLQLSEPALHPRLSSCREKRGRAPSGQACTFYSISDVRKACSDLLEKVPKAGKDGTFKADGEIWGTLRALTRITGVSRDAIRTRKSACRKQTGKDSGGRIAVFYTLSDVKKACADLLRKK